MMATVGIITTVGTYEHFVPEWYASVKALHRQPDLVVVAAQNAQAVADLVDDSSVVVVQPEQPFQFGEYLNYAVERCTTDWVAWLGVDDLYRPNAFDDIDTVAADVQVFGMRITDGREWLGHPFNTAYQQNPVPCGSPFRRWVWEATPFAPEIGPYVDWAFWLGAYANGASAEPATRVHFDYRLHKDQIVPSHAPHAARVREWADRNFDRGALYGDH